MSIFGKPSGYRWMDVYVLANIVELGTDRFCEDFLNFKNDPGGRTFGQMNHAARSGCRNLAEGSERLAAFCGNFHRKSREGERKCHARLTREYTDGGANICAEATQFSSAKNKFFADENEISTPLRGYPFRRPCIAALSLTLIALASKP
jgi:hypothetical protein